MTPILFWILATISVVSAFFVVLKRSPLASALALAVNLVALAGLFAGLSASFLFIVQILVYAGAVVVLIIFVIMLLNLREESLREQSIQKGKLLGGAVVCLAGTAFLLWVIGQRTEFDPVALPAGFGSVMAMAGELFTRWVLAFEVISLILLVGIIGAVVIAKKGE